MLASPIMDRVVPALASSFRISNLHLLVTSAPRPTTAVAITTALLLTLTIVAPPAAKGRSQIALKKLVPT